MKALPEDDGRILELERLWRHGEQIEVGQQGAYEMGRFRFFAEDVDMEQFLDQVVSLAQSDAGERGRFGGQQVPGDEPWG